LLIKMGRAFHLRDVAAPSILILASLLVSPFLLSNAEARSGQDRVKINTFVGYAVWDDLSIELSDIGTITTIELSVSDSEGDIDTNEVFLNLGRLEDGALLQGRTHDDIIFEIDKRLDTAKLNAVDVDICLEGDLDDCGGFEQVTIEVEWQGIGDKERTVNPDDIPHFKEVQWAKEAVAQGTIDGIELGTSDDGRIAYDTIKGIIPPCC
jgi:hypothetical protein